MQQIVTFVEKESQKISKVKVREHCYYIGKYRGAAHSICDVRLNVSNKIPVVFHNK